MPIREYECERCGVVFEVLYGATETQLEVADCQACDGEAKRIISRTSFALKGSGWYVTDYGACSDKKGQG